MPEPEQTPNPEPETPKAPEGPTNEQVMAAIRDANFRAAAAERSAILATDAITRAAQPPQTPRPDPLDRYSSEDMVMSPDEKKRHLAAAIAGRAREEGDRVRREMDERFAMERHAIESKVALDMVRSVRPELNDPKNASNFAAALTKAKFEADQAGYQLSPSDLAQRAGQVYDEVFRKNTNAPLPPRFEGAGRPDLANPMNNIEVITHQSQLEKIYGAKKGNIKEMYDVNDPKDIDNLNLSYIRVKNQPLLKKGVVTNLDVVRAQSEDPVVG